MSKLFLGAGLVLLLLALSCTHESGLPDPDPTPTPTDTTGNDTTTVNTCNPDTVYFEREVLPMLVSNCAMSGCHDNTTAADGYRLTSYTNVMARGVVAGSATSSKIYKVLIDSDPNDRMPPAPASALSAAQIAVIQKWINQGAKNLTCTTGCDTTAVTYANSIGTFMQTSCVGCHSGASPSGGVNLSSYANVKLVAQSGALYGSVANTGAFSKMPPSGTVSVCTQNQIKAWIHQGMPE